MLRLQDEKDIEVLRKAALLLESENKRLVAEVVRLNRELLQAQGEGQDPEQLALRLAELERQLALRNRKLFGDSSEKRPTSDSDPEPSNSAEPKRRRGHGPRAQPKLPTIERVHDLDEPDKVCPSCGAALHEMQGQSEDSEEVDVIERRFVVVKHKRKKYVCNCGACVETAPGPIKLTSGGRYSVGFAIEVAIGKYCDHLPLERQARIMGREGLEVGSQTLWNQLDELGVVLRPAHGRLLDYIRSHGVIHADETVWKMLGYKKGSSKRWVMWALGCQDAVYYEIQQSRSTDSAAKLLADYKGVVMCDGCPTYTALEKRYESLTLSNCWAHVRRKFVETEGSFPKQAGEIIELIGELYEIERLCPPGSDGDDVRRQLRQQRSRDVLERIRAWVKRTQALPHSGLGKAISYMMDMWEGLTRFVDDPRIPLDNNLIERAIRGPVIGRKNHYGSRSRRGTQVAAILYSLIETAKLVGLDPKAYLHAAVTAGLNGQVVPLPHELVTAQARAP